MTDDFASSHRCGGVHRTLGGRSVDPQKVVEAALRHLGQVVSCFAAGLLLVHDHHGQTVLHRFRPVDDLFLQAVQQRLMRSYQLYVGAALTEPEVGVTVRGDSISGPFEPPRALLTTPILSEGRVIGMIAVASIFPDAFCNKDLCMLSVVAARVSMSLAPVPGILGDSEP